MTHDPLSEAGLGVEWGRPGRDPIPTEPAELEDTKRSAEGVALAFGWPIAVLLFIFVVACVAIWWPA